MVIALIIILSIVYLCGAFLMYQIVKVDMGTGDEIALQFIDWIGVVFWLVFAIIILIVVVIAKMIRNLWMKLRSLNLSTKKEQSGSVNIQN